MHPRHHAATDPNKPATIMADTGETLTYGALEARANQGAQAFRRMGLKSGDAIAVWLPNGLDYYELFWAAQRAGLLFVPLAVTLTAEEAAYIIEDSGAKLVVVNGKIAHLADLSGHNAARRVWSGEPFAGAEEWARLRDAEPETPITDEAPGTYMVYSSGTTGRPKGIRPAMDEGPIDAPNILTMFVSHRYGWNGETVYLSPAPIYHTAPLAYTLSVHRLGGTVIMMRKFDPEGWLAAVEKHRATFSQMVPTMFHRLLRLPEEARRKYDLSSLREIVHAAAPCPVETKRAMIEWLGPIVSEYYAGSEGNGSTFITSEEWLKKPGSVGKAALGVLHVCGEDGAELAPGEPGTIYFEGLRPFSYHNDPDKTTKAQHPAHAGWTTLGDVGYLDADGYLFLTDRKSFMIISGGVNIYPQEAENVLATHPRVADVAVIGVPDAEMGEAVKAVVQPLDWDDATPEFAEELVAWCRERLSHVKCPKSVDFERELPRAETGKLYKRLIRDRYWAGQGGKI